MQHLAADHVQVLDRVRVIVDVAQVQPDLFLVEVVVHVLVGGAGIVAAAGGDADAGVHLRVDLAVGAQASTDALAILVAAAVVGFAIDLDGFLADPNVALELRLGRPGQLLVEGAQLVGFLGRRCHLFVGFLLRLLSDLLGLLILGQFGLQFNVLRLGNRAVCLEHVEQFGVDRSTGGHAHGQ